MNQKSPSAEDDENNKNATDEQLGIPQDNHASRQLQQYREMMSQRLSKQSTNLAQEPMNRSESINEYDTNKHLFKH